MNEPRDYFDLMEPIWERFLMVDEEEFLRQAGPISAWQRHIYASHLCQVYVRNGGLHSYLLQGMGALCPEAIEGFTAIGMPRTAVIVQMAMDWFGPDFPRDVDDRNDVMDRLEQQYFGTPDWSRYFRCESRGFDPFEELDTAFFELIDKENGGYDEAATNCAIYQGDPERCPG